MKVLITGANGQVGRALQLTAPAGAQVIPTGVADLDIRDAAAVSTYVRDLGPSMIINAAAYTAVDKAETDEPEALRVNRDAVANLSGAANAHGAGFVHISTDFVFDGTRSTPYPPDAAPAPISAYGRTKFAGEQAAGNDALIVRTSWVYAARGSNFVLTMLRLMAERDELRVIADQIGTPTLATSIAEAIWALAGQARTGLWHHTDSGTASWYDFAVAIQEEALSLGLLTREVPIIPIATSGYPTPARRPQYSVLDKSLTIAALGSTAPHWRVNLRKMLKEVLADG
ncbi:dTDP-4-dehydrorhamnose reductase [Novosphingobium sp.]|uniref:dTDP-4-dehydrorhamnose reductase n=1 Tax=Novosphingobium sp. TaxID=1874826 RepID=UPI001E135CD9|nr:dTDP-4-dehydrorhamnose reductase [Novosphingobium sp.]MBX9665322.1 dTDP-4-dehydrorhamnose reductase [Novosphingobium sp.]